MGTVLKRVGDDQSILNIFELLGSDEVATTKAFAYLISSSPKILTCLLKEIGLPYRTSLKTFKKVSVEIERFRTEGRTDIEIKCENQFHVIIEAKIKKNKLHKQRNQYMPSFDGKYKKQVMCFITSERIASANKINDVGIVYITWRDILIIVEESLKGKLSKEEMSLAKNFISFYQRGINMREQKEVLIQDLSDVKEIELFKTYNVYRRNETYGIPLYFAPHFSKKANQEEGVGISYLSGVLGVLTISPLDINKYEHDLKKFAGENSRLVKTWLLGIEIISNKIIKRGSSVKNPKIMTFYFLDNPVKIKLPLQKDGGIKQGRGKGWIAASIPKNRCVSFSKFCEKLVG
jgi:hypothetical protein